MCPCVGEHDNPESEIPLTNPLSILSAEPTRTTIRTLGPPPTFEYVRTPAHGIPSRTPFRISFRAHGASSVFLEWVGYIGDGFTMEAPEETTTYTLRAANVNGETTRQFTITIDNTPKLLDTRPESAKLREKLAAAGRTWAASLSATLPLLRQRGGPMADAAEQLQSHLRDLQRVCRLTTMLPGARSSNASFADVINGIAREISHTLSTAEEAVAATPGWEPAEEPDAEAITIVNGSGSLWSMATQLRDEVLEENRAKAQRITA